jgi:hypothetical protein
LPSIAGHFAFLDSGKNWLKFDQEAWLSKDEQRSGFAAAAIGLSAYDVARHAWEIARMRLQM